ncbi:MAG: hypothetical protein RBS80_08160 [Thermoguttaceae bacterium]|jgi:hypothetical protein|nr:hypothetical protein [Thermoguttaceae bacterium]
MSITDAIKRLLTSHEKESFDARLERMRDARTAPVIPDPERMEQLEDDLARTHLLIHALVEACLNKGVFTRQQLSEACARLDLLDGVADGKLDPAVLRPKKKKATRPERCKPKGERGP